MSDLLFDVPWWLPTLLAIVGISIAVSGNRRQNDSLRNRGLGLILLAIAWVTLSVLVDTDKEKCQKQTRQFVKSVVDRNWQTFDSLLDADVAFRFEGSPWSIVGRDALDNALKADINHISVDSASITSMSAHEESGTIAVHIVVWSTQKSTMGEPLNSEWKLSWQRFAGKYLLHEIRAIRVANLTPEQVQGSLPVR
ncbi:MAG TPA: hypothetical protein VIM11_08375 [Tepidisphaeraceae bacterium]|jgi:hypothetical protein